LELAVAEKIAKVGGTAVADDKSTVTDGIVVEVHKFQRFAERWIGNGTLPGPANSRGRWVLWMVRLFKKPQGRGFRLRGDYGGSRRRRTAEGFFEQRAKGGCRVASSPELTPEFLDNVLGVGRVRTEGLGSVDRASNQPVEDTWRVRRTGREVQVQVQRLVVEDMVEPSALERDRQVKENDLMTSRAGDPLKTMPAVEAALKAQPKAFVLDRIRVRDPDSKDIVNVTLVVSETMAEHGEKLVFVGAIRNVGIGGRWRGAHGGTHELVPEGIPELKHIAFHDQGESFNEGRQREGRELGLVAHDVVVDGLDGGIGVDVCVHRRSISGEQAAVRWQGQALEFLDKNE
jgi:hypothetical protein